MSGVKTIPAEEQNDLSGASVDPQTYEEMTAGAPSVMYEIPTHRLADYEDAAASIPIGAENAPDGMVRVINIRFSGQKIYVPDATVNGTARFNPQRYIEFQDRLAIVTPTEANFVKSICPWVYIEPTEGQFFPLGDGWTRSLPASNEFTRLRQQGRI